MLDVERILEDLEVVYYEWEFEVNILIISLMIVVYKNDIEKIY